MLNKLLQWLFGVSLVRTPRSLMSQKGIKVENGNFVTSKGPILEEPPKRECPLGVKPSAITKDDDLGIVMPDFFFDDPTETKPMVRTPKSIDEITYANIKKVVYAVRASVNDRNTVSSTITFMVSLDTMGRVRGLSYPPLDCLKAHESWGDAGVRELGALQHTWKRQFGGYYGYKAPEVSTTPMAVLGDPDHLIDVRYLPPVNITRIPNQPCTARAKGVTRFYAVQDLDKVILNKGEETRDAVLARGPRIKVALENGLAVKYNNQYWISIPGLVLMTGLEITRKKKIKGTERKLPIRDGIKHILDQLRRSTTAS